VGSIPITRSIFLSGGVAQLARAFGSYPKGRGFDPLHRYQQQLLIYMAVVAKGLTHRIVAPAFVGSSPIDRPILSIFAVVVELADTPSWGGGGATRASSSLADRTKLNQPKITGWFERVSVIYWKSRFWNKWNNFVSEVGFIKMLFENWTAKRFK
jgi:hypothetical protein